MAAVFIAQSTLTQWSDAGKVRLQGTVLHLLKEQRSVLLKPAVRFVKLVVGDADPHGLLGKVKTDDQLKELGAEHYMDSVILGDTAYEVVEGFMGDLMAAEPTASAPPPAAAAPAPAAPSGAPPAPSAPAQVAGLAPDAQPQPEDGDVEEDVEEADAEALSRLFLDTVR